MRDVWQREVTPKNPAHFDGASGVLEIHSCCWCAGAASTLSCVVGGNTFNLGSVGVNRPHCKVAVRLEEDAVLVCDRERLLVQGVLIPHSRSTSLLPPNKRARVEVASDTQEQLYDRGTDASVETSKKFTEKETKTEVARGGATASSVAGKEAGATTKEDSKKQAAKLVESSAVRGEKRSITVQSDGRPLTKMSASSEQTQTRDAAKGATQDKVKVPDKTGVGSRHVLPGGLEYEVLKLGKGSNTAARGKTVKVKYEGRLAKTGKRFDKGSIKFKLGAGEVIKGWDDGVKGMLAGERRRLLVPARLAYGSRGAPPDIPPNAALVFEVEYLQ